MRFDFKPHLAAVERSVSSPRRDGEPARAVTLSRGYPTTAEDLWDAVTNPDRIPRWFTPVGGDLEPGGRYQLEGNAGGVIEVCEPPSLLALTWVFGEYVSWVEARVSGDDAGGARLKLTHTAPVSEHWRQYGAGATGVGWETCPGGTRDPCRPTGRAEAGTRPNSSVRRVAGRSSWGAARRGGRRPVAGGEDPDAARAAARRTTAFYTGEADGGG